MAAADAEGSFERISAVVEACVYYLKDGVNCEDRKEGGTRLTSEFRELVSIPTAAFRSRRTVLVPSLAANCLAIANPTAPPPMT